MTEDQQLLQSYVRDGSRASLDLLIRRHLDLVYSSALRQTRGDSHLAEDITQAVFIVLAQKGQTIRQHTSIGSWLISVTRHAALNAIKKRAIQRRHEAAAAKPEASMDHSNDWAFIEPVLDEALNSLTGKDRDAVVLRFFQERSFSQIGMELGLNEAAARKRVSRALENLRRLLRRGGTAVGSDALGAVIATHAVKSAPSDLLTKNSASTTVTNIAKGVSNMIILAKVRLIASIAATIVVVGGVAIVATTKAQTQPPPSVAAAPATQPAQATVTAPGNFDPAAARKAIIARFEALQNLSISLNSSKTTNVENLPGQFQRLPATSPGSIKAITPPVGQARLAVSDQDSDEMISLLGTNLRIDTSQELQMSLTDSARSKMTRTMLSRGDVSESFGRTITNGKANDSGTIKNANLYIFMREPILYALGVVRLQVNSQSPENPLLTTSDIEKMEISATSQGNVVLKHPVGEADYREEWEFSPNLSYAIVAYRAIAPNQLRPSPEITASDFRMVNGIMLPYLAKMDIQPTFNGRAAVTSSTHVTVKEYKLNDPENTEARYHINWPEGALVSLNSNAFDYVADKDGKLMSLEEVALNRFKEIARASTTQPTALEGKFAAPISRMVLKDIQLSRPGALVDLQAGRNAARGEKYDLSVTLQPYKDINLNWNFSGSDLLLFKLPAAVWDKPDPAMVKTAIASANPGVIVRVSKTTRSNLIDYKLGDLPELPMVFAYRTKEGATGLLRITELKYDVTGTATIDLLRIVP